MLTLLRFAIISVGLVGLSFVPIYRAYNYSRDMGDLVTLGSGIGAAVLIILISLFERSFKRTLIASALLSLMALPAIAVLGTYVRGPMMGYTQWETFAVFRSAVVFFAGMIILQAFGYACYLKSFIRYLKDGPAYKRRPGVAAE